MTSNINVNFRDQPSALIRVVAHGFITILMFYTILEADKIDFSEIKLYTIRNLKKYRYFTCTFLTASLTFVIFSLYTALDLLEIIPKPDMMSKVLKTIRKIDDLLFISISLPITISVCSAFWLGRMLYGKDVYPEEMNKYIPEWINHMVHTAPIFFYFFEFFFENHKSPSLKYALTYLTTTITIYTITLITLRVKNGEWIYYIIDIYVNTLFKITMMFIILGYLTPIFFLIVCLKANDYYWGTKSGGYMNNFTSKMKIK